MKIDLKTTVLLSGLLAIILNIAQFASTYARPDAFTPSWAYTSPSPSRTVAPAKLAANTPPPRAGTVPEAVAPAQTDVSIAAIAGHLSAAGLNPNYAGLYLSVQQTTGTPWQLLAAVHHFETGQSDSTNRTSSAGATGPMQFLPATFNHYAVDGNHDGRTDVHDLSDSMYTAGRYLAAGGADRGRYNTALYNYNHSWDYVYRVMGLTHNLGL